MRCGVGAVVDPCDLPHVCDQGTRVPDSDNCNGYLECDYGVRWIKRNCSAGTCFDSVSRECVIVSVGCTCQAPCPPYTGPPTTILPPGKPMSCYFIFSLNSGK